MHSTIPLRHKLVWDCLHWGFFDSLINDVGNDVFTPANLHYDATFETEHAYNYSSIVVHVVVMNYCSLFYTSLVVFPQLALLYIRKDYIFLADLFP